jgi:aquaporin Z
MAEERLTVARALREHWPEYLMEGWSLGAFMVSAGLFATLLEYPGSPVPGWIPDGDLRRVLMGLAMGATAIGIIYSPWGKRSGAHINPAVTLSFLRLGKVNPIDAGFYIAAQFAGGALGVLIVWTILGAAFADPPVLFVNTMPGAAGIPVAFLTELAMAFGLMAMIVVCLPRPRLASLIGVFAGVFVATYISLLAPLSGMSINPARTFASAAPEAAFDFLWLYFTAPVIGMLLAAELSVRLPQIGSFVSPKLCPNKDTRCIFTGWDPKIRGTDKTIA